jgi:hypothetical protein
MMTIAGVGGRRSQATENNNNNNNNHPLPLRRMMWLLLFQHWLSPHHTVISLGILHIQYQPPPESAARGVGKLCRWSKPAKPTTLTFYHICIHIYIHIHTLNPHPKPRYSSTRSHVLSVCLCVFVHGTPNIIWPCHNAISPLHTKTLSHLYALTHTHLMFTCEFTHIEHGLAHSTCHAHGLAHSTCHSHACLKPFSQPFTSLNHHFNASSISKQCTAPVFNNIIHVEKCAMSLFVQHAVAVKLHCAATSFAVEGFYRHGMGFWGFGQKNRN